MGATLKLLTEFGKTVKNSLGAMPAKSPSGKALMRMNVGSEPLPGYRLKRRLGQGGSGEVWLAEAPGGLAKAIKIALIDQALAQRELEGLQAIRDIRHPFLLVIERFELIDGLLIVVMELADTSAADRFDECVAQGMPGIPREELLSYLREAAEVLDAMSSKHGILHLDVKPTNLLMLSGHVKVADFGLAQSKDATMSPQNMAFTPTYAAPEVVFGLATPVSDLYSLAITYQELLTGSRPYTSTHIVELVDERKKNPPDVSPLPEKDRIVMRRALDLEPANRFGNCTDFVAALLDPTTFIRSLSPAEHRRLAGLENELVISPLPPSRRFSTAPALDGVRPEALPIAAKPASVSKPPAEIPTRPSAAAMQKALAQKPKVQEWRGAEVRTSFVASLPKEMFALKLKAFIEAAKPRIASLSDGHVDLEFPLRNWLGMKTAKGHRMLIDVYRANESGSSTAVEVTIRGLIEGYRGTDFAHRAELLLRTLKSYFMATGGVATRF